MGDMKDEMEMERRYGNDMEMVWNFFGVKKVNYWKLGSIGSARFCCRGNVVRENYI